LESLIWFGRDLLCAVGAYAVFAHFGHVDAGLGMAYIIGGLAVAARLPERYSQGDPGSLGPRDL
jgi:hypothetical protein